MIITWTHQFLNSCSFNVGSEIISITKKWCCCWRWWNIHWNFRYSLICLDTCFRCTFKRTCLYASVCVICPHVLGNILRSMSFSFELFFRNLISCFETKKAKKTKRNKNSWGHWTCFKNIFWNLCYAFFFSFLLECWSLL